MAKAFYATSGGVERTYDVAADGKGFLGLISAAELRVVLNWFDELKTRVPIGK